MSFCRVEILGHLGASPELRYSNNGDPVSSFRVAVNERFTDKNNEPQQRTTWHKITVWGPQAEVCAKYLSKGRQVFIEGTLRNSSWEDKEGATHYATEIIAKKVHFLDKVKGS